MSIAEATIRSMYWLAVISALLTTACSLHLPFTTGPYNVGSKPYLLSKVTRNDPVAPNGTGTSLLINVYYPTLEDAPSIPYLWKGLSSYFEEAYSLPCGVFGDTTAQIVYAAKPLHHEESKALSLPTLLWGPPFAGPPSQMFLSLFSELVSVGYTIVTVDHLYEQTYLEYPDGTGVPSSLSDDIEPDDQLITRVHDYRLEDNSAVLDALPEIAEALRMPLNLTHVAYFGHSLGGSAAINQLLVVDRTRAPEIMGAINLDGKIYPPAVVGNSSADVCTPSLLIASDVHLSTGETSLQTFVLGQSAWAKEISVHGKTNHTDFSDLVVLEQGNGVEGGAGAITAERMVNFTRTFVKAFFDVVSGREEGEGVLSGSREVGKEWPEVVFEFSDMGRSQ